MKNIFPALLLLVITKLAVSQNTSFTLPNPETKVVTDNVMYLESATAENILYKSTDQGASIDSLTKFSEITNVYFYDKDNGFVIGNTGELFKTSDGGKSWDTLNLPSGGYEIECFDKNTCLMRSSNNVYKTIDGGENWLSTNHPTVNKIRSIEINSSGKAIFAEYKSNSTNIYTSSDYGDNWTYGGELSISSYSMNFSLMDNGNIISIKPYTNDINISSDNGNSWDTQSISLEEGKYLYSMDDNGKYVVAACTTSSNLILVCSDDYGQSWQINSFSDKIQSLYNVQITPGSVVYTFGHNYDVEPITTGYRSYGNISCFSPSVSSEEVIPAVELVYPNPSTAIFSFNSDFEGNYSVFDISGKKVLSSKELTFDLSNHNAGIYFLHYETNGVTGTQKIIKK